MPSQKCKQAAQAAEAEKRRVIYTTGVNEQWITYKSGHKDRRGPVGSRVDHDYDYNQDLELYCTPPTVGR